MSPCNAVEDSVYFLQCPHYIVTHPAHKEHQHHYHLKPIAHIHPSQADKSSPTHPRRKELNQRQLLPNNLLLKRRSRQIDDIRGRDETAEEQGEGEGEGTEMHFVVDDKGEMRSWAVQE